MCAINGVFAFHPAASVIKRDEVIRTRDHMVARGPDGCGVWFSEDGRVGLGHRRLSIIDLSEAGAQPMVSADGRFVVTFNGEIYNYRALRHDLETEGRVFKSQSDTEILLHLYVKKGTEMVHDLRGMFAFAIWDGERRTLFLARDPYGIKPLYYSDDGFSIRFASQVKSLLKGQGASLSNPQPAGLVGFLVFGSVPEPFTLHRGVQALPAGSTLYVDHRGVSPPQQFYSIAKIYAERGPNKATVVKSERDTQIRQALLDSISHHLVSDVPVGAFLSGGVDSGALVGLMRDVGQHEIQTVTLAFDEYVGTHEDEAPLAETLAKRFNTEHTTRVVTRSEFVADFPRILEAMDQPSIDGINTWFVSKAATELGLKVVISGLGGDELFGGYPSFTDIPRWVARCHVMSQIPWFGRLVREVLKGLKVDSLTGSSKSLSIIEYSGSIASGYLLRRGLFMPWELHSILDHDVLEQGLQDLQPLMMLRKRLSPKPKSNFAKVATLEASMYMRNQLLRDTDWASMAHGLEVRVPLVDTKLLETVAMFSDNQMISEGKSLLACAPSDPLPDAVLKRPKIGFNIPVGRWLAGPPKHRSSAVPVNQSKANASREWAKKLIALNRRNATETLPLAEAEILFNEN